MGVSRCEDVDVHLIITMDHCLEDNVAERSVYRVKLVNDVTYKRSLVQIIITMIMTDSVFQDEPGDEQSTEDGRKRFHAFNQDLVWPGLSNGCCT